MSKLIIQNSLLTATMNDDHKEFSSGHILVENGIITSIGHESLTIDADEVIDATGMVVLPGFINTHHHLYQTLTRNIPRMQNLSLFNWLNYHYEIWRELTEEMVYVSARSGLLELMKSGVTTSSDHLYIFPDNAGKYLIDAEIKVAQELGIRFHPTRGSMSLGRSKGGLPPDDVVQSEAVIQKDIERLISQYHDDSEGSMLRISLAPCSPFSVTPKLMKFAAEFARTHHLHIHTHLAEALDEELFCLEKFGLRPVEYLNSLGWIRPNCWFAHAIHLTDKELKQLADANVGISHCPTSNMRLGSGIARIKEMLQLGIHVSLGVDGSASNDSGNMLTEIRNAMLLSRLRDEEYWLSARDVLWMATRGGATVLGREDIGQLKEGKRADLAIFSVNNLEYAGGMSDPLASLVFNVRISPVDYLIINGEIRIRNGKSSIDEDNLIFEHNRLSNEMLQRAFDRSGIDFLVTNKSI